MNTKALLDQQQNFRKKLWKNFCHRKFWNIAHSKEQFFSSWPHTKFNAPTKFAGQRNESARFRGTRFIAIYEWNIMFYMRSTQKKLLFRISYVSELSVTKFFFLHFSRKFCWCSGVPVFSGTMATALIYRWTLAHATQYTPNLYYVSNKNKREKLIGENDKLIEIIKSATEQTPAKKVVKRATKAKK